MCIAFPSGLRGTFGRTWGCVAYCTSDRLTVVRLAGKSKRAGARLVVLRGFQRGKTKSPFGVLSLRRYRVSFPRWERNGVTCLHCDTGRSAVLPSSVGSANSFPHRGKPFYFYSTVNASLSRPMRTVVPAPRSDSIAIVCPSRVRMRRQRYRPIPVARLSSRPL